MEGLSFSEVKGEGVDGGRGAKIERRNREKRRDRGETMIRLGELIN